MDRDRIFKFIYAGIAIFGSYLFVSRLLTGDWVSALWPFIIVAFCVYRLLTIDD
jgi:hypothetical protein